MFNREDYWPYVVGTFVFAGLFAIPFVYSQFVLPLMDEPFRSLPSRHVMIGSLAACALFTFAHTRKGMISIGRMLGGIILAVLLYVRFQGANLFLQESIVFVPIGLLGVMLMSAGGWLGIMLARWSGISEKLVPKDPAQMHELGTKAAVESEIGQPDSPLNAFPTNSDALLQAFTPEQYREFISRTRDAWLLGTYESWRPGMRRLAAGKPSDRFHELIKPAVEAIFVAFARNAPTDDEVLIYAQDAGSAVSTVLTNKRFFFFETDPNRLKDHFASGVIALENIEHCEIRDKFLDQGATLTLENGETIKVGGLDSLVPLYCINNSSRTSVDPAEREPTSENREAARYLSPDEVLIALHAEETMPSRSEFLAMSADRDYARKFGIHLVLFANRREKALFFGKVDVLPREFTQQVARELAAEYDDQNRKGQFLLAGASVLVASTVIYSMTQNFRWWMLLILLVCMLPLWWLKTDLAVQRFLGELRKRKLKV